MPTVLGSLKNTTAYGVFTEFWKIFVSLLVSEGKLVYAVRPCALGNIVNVEGGIRYPDFAIADNSRSSLFSFVFEQSKGFRNYLRYT